MLLLLLAALLREGTPSACGSRCRRKLMTVTGRSSLRHRVRAQVSKALVCV